MQNQCREPKIEVWGRPELLGAWTTGDALTVTHPHAALDLRPTVIGIHLENARPFTFSPEPLLFHTLLCHHALKTHIYVLPPCWWLDDKEFTCNARDQGSIPGSESSPGEGNGHSSILTWRIPWTEETGGLESMGSQIVGHN